jgi:hypothetical protein
MPQFVGRGLLAILSDMGSRMNQERRTLHTLQEEQTDELFYNLAEIKYMRRGGKRT